MKYKVIEKCSLVVNKDSIVELDPLQAKLAEGLVVPYKEPKEQKKKTDKKGE